MNRPIFFTFRRKNAFFIIKEDHIAIPSVFQEKYNFQPH